MNGMQFVTRETVADVDNNASDVIEFPAALLHLASSLGLLRLSERL